MARIGKIYAYSYEEYKDFKDWADKQVYTFYDGFKVCIGNKVWNIKKKWFPSESGIAIMSSSEWLDAYLIQKCPHTFVTKRLKSVYCEETYKYLQNLDLSGKPTEDLKQNRKIVIKCNKYSAWSVHSRPFRVFRKSKGNIQTKWHVTTYDNLDYNEDTKTWVHGSLCYPTNTNCSEAKSIKSLVRHLRKQYLPTGITFHIHGRYKGEYYDVHIR